MIGTMTIGQLAARTGLTVRTLRFYADAGVLPEEGRSESGYRLFGSEAVARARCRAGRRPARPACGGISGRDRGRARGRHRRADPRAAPAAGGPARRRP